MDLLIVARHAESTYNLEGRVSADPHAEGELTVQGKAQARRLGKAVAQESIGLCVTSGIHRARATAELALGNSAVPRIVMDEFNDPLAGSFEGASVEAFNAWLNAHPAEEAPPGGESQVEACIRSQAGFMALLDRPESVILLVSHRLSIGWLLAALSEDGVFPTLDYAVPIHLHSAEVAQAATKMTSLNHVVSY
jgi:probable phosphoglycerate mutase